MLRALARVNLAAVERNVARLCRDLADGTQLAAVVKADAYGHGAAPCARAALAGGASWLAVATAREAAELRAEGIEAKLLVMGALGAEEVDVAVGAGADIVAWDEAFVEALAEAAARAGMVVRAHVKLDTGMGRLGTRDPEVADRVAEAIAAAPELELAGAMTHFATADDPASDFFGSSSPSSSRGARTEGAPPRHPSPRRQLARHAARPRGPLRPRALRRRGLRDGSLQRDPAPRELEPVLALESWVSTLKPCAPGQSAGYGRRFVAERDTQLGVLPIGYGDGVRRGLTNNGEVLVGGARAPVVGTVSMDNITVDLGPSPAVGVGEAAVLIGEQGGERILAEDVARRLDTINYEITCGLTARCRACTTATARGVSEALAQARAALAGEDAWLVGGVLRDRLLDLETTDLDVVVSGDAGEAARRVARATGGAPFALSDAFGAWRVVGPDQAWQVDLTPLRGAGIEGDLALRDFTVNAMAEPIDGGELIDPFGGAGDLAARRLRMVAARAFDDDPLRVLRVARFACELGLAVDPETAAVAREHAGGLADVAGERVFAELKRVICADAVRDGLALMDDLGATPAILPELTALRGVEQSHYHHLDVLEHTLAVLDAVVELERDPGPALGEHAEAAMAVLAEPLADGLTRGDALRFGALLHDAAKPQTRAETPEGRITFMGHDAAGAELSRAVLSRLRTSDRLQAHVAALARHHLRLGFLVHERPLTRRHVFRYLRACEPVEVDVTVLSVADRLATRGRRADDAIPAHLGLARELLGEALRWRAEGPREPLVRGDELAAELGIVPGPGSASCSRSSTRASFAGRSPRASRRSRSRVR